MNEKLTFPALNTPSLAPSVLGGQHWSARVLPNYHQRYKIDLDKPVIRRMSG